MKKIFVTSLLLLATVGIVCGRRTTRRNLHPIDSTAVGVDTPTYVVLAADSVPLSFKGYDKPLTAGRESFFAVNADSLHTIDGFVVDITYYDMQGRMLHRRREHIAKTIPAGETRRIVMPSWDTQHTFYYHLSKRPTRTSAVPYSITMTADSVAVRLQNSDL